MLKTNTLIEKLGEEYAPMLKEVNIPDFTKCIAQFSGINIKDLDDKVIEEYLTKWAKNKKYIYDVMGCLRADMPIEYKEEDVDYRDKLTEIGIKYPTYYPWIQLFDRQKTNKIEELNSYHLYEANHAVEKCFPGYTLQGTTLTHFFKSKLNAPEEMVTEIGRIFENQSISATFTISIDPVDIMLSSENPYNWTSCYRLENCGFNESHADGCLAGVVDKATIITYIWNNEGKYNLYNNYTFKNIRYKKVRMTIAVNENFTAIHFNIPYPGKSNYSADFKKLLRLYIEDYFDKQLGRVGLLWKKSEYNDAYSSAHRINDNYGYGEYCGDNVYVLSGNWDYAKFKIYNEVFSCPCGCGEEFIGTQCDDYNYSGDGLINDNFYYEHYCEIQDEYIDCDGDCRNCAIWCRDNAVCELDTEHYCDRDAYEAENEGDLNPYRSNIMHCDPDHCATCPLYKLHHPEEADSIEEE